jgi:hypothetical protein
MVLSNDYYCEECGETYVMDFCHKWCKTCQINYLKNDFTNWTSGNEEIDNFIQESQMRINKWIKNHLIPFEWIPYDQFSCIKEIGKSGFATIYSAIWKGGPLLYYNYCSDKKEYIRNSDTKVVLKCLHNLQNINEVLDQV